jgi:hypothetical protein
MVERKKIEPGQTREIVNRLEELSASAISARQFIIMYFDQLLKSQQSGRSLKTMYEFIRGNGIDIGTYESFQAVYNRIKRARKSNPVESASSKTIPEQTEPETPAQPEKAVSAQTEAEKAKNEDGVKNRPRGVGLKPVYLADGTEIEIDPETGAKHFKIKSNRRPQE